MLNSHQARVVDPVLTKLVQGYKHAERVGHVLFPAVDVPVAGGQVLEFGRESFRLYQTVRAPGAPTLKVPLHYQGKPYHLANCALDVPIPREYLRDAKVTIPTVDMGVQAISLSMFSLTLGLEAEQAQIATDPANFGANNKLVLGGASQWSDPASDPINDMAAAKEAVRQSGGIDPNCAVVSKPGFNALREHPKIVERFRYTSGDSITADMLAKLFDLDRLAVGKAMAVTDSADSPKFYDVWGNCAVLAYVPAQSLGAMEPSFGYTYTLKGHPFVEPAREDKDVKSFIYGVSYERRPVLTGIASGFLIQNVA